MPGLRHATIIAALLLGVAAGGLFAPRLRAHDWRAGILAPERTQRLAAWERLAHDPFRRDQRMPEIWDALAGADPPAIMDARDALGDGFNDVPDPARIAIIAALARHPEGATYAADLAHETLERPLPPDAPAILSVIRRLAADAGTEHEALRLAAAAGASTGVLAVPEAFPRNSVAAAFARLDLPPAPLDLSSLAAREPTGHLLALLADQPPDAEALVPPLANVLRAALLAERLAPMTREALARSWHRSLDDDAKRAAALLAALCGAGADELAIQVRDEENPSVRTAQRLALAALAGTPSSLGHRAQRPGGHLDAVVLALRLAADEPSARRVLLAEWPPGESTVDRMLLVRRFCPEIADRVGWPVSGATDDLQEHADRLAALWMITPP